MAPSDSNGLVELSNGVAVVLTGVHTGDVHVDALPLDHEPPAPDLDQWDEVVEVSLQATLGHLRVVEPMTDRTVQLPQLSAHGPGWYRLRAHAVGRDAVSAVDERYLVLSWLARPRRETVFKQADETGALYRSPAAEPSDEPTLAERFLASPYARNVESGDDIFPPCERAV